jgi:hypothetical protein
VVQKLLRNGAADLLVSLTLFLGLLLLDRLALPGFAVPGVFGLLVAVSLCVSLMRTLLFGCPTYFETAMVADATLRLKERVSSALYVRDLMLTGTQERFDDDIQALLERDAAVVLKDVSPKEHFPLRWPRQAPWLALILLLSGLLALWLPSYDFLGIGRRETAGKELKNAVEEKQKELDRRLAELEKEAEEKRTPEAKELLELLRREELKNEQKPVGENPAAQNNAGDKSPGNPQKVAMVELARREDGLKKGLESEKFDKLKDARKALEKLGLKDAKLTRKLQSALKEGDFEKAKKELESLQDEFEKLSKKAASELTPEEKERLSQLADELSKLSRDAGALSNLSQALSKASAGLSAGDMAQALEGMNLSEEELDSLSKLKSEMGILDQALELVKLSKEELSQLCPQCGTPSCPDCGKPQCGCSKPGMKPGGT